MKAFLKLHAELCKRGGDDELWMVARTPTTKVHVGAY